MATEQEWQTAYDEATAGSNEPGRFQYVYAGQLLSLEGWMDTPLDQRPDELPDGDDDQYVLDGYISDLDDEAGFSLWYEGGVEALMETDGKLPHIHTWMYWARFHEDTEEMNDHFISQCDDKDMSYPAWYS